VPDFPQPNNQNRAGQAIKRNETDIRASALRRKLQAELAVLRSELRDRREDLFGLCCGVQRGEKADARQLTSAIMCVKRLQEQVEEIEQNLAKLNEATAEAA
jgi:hypothetical protein